MQHSNAGIHLPLVNEVAAVAIGCGLGNPHVDPSFKATVENNVAAWKAANPKVSLVYAQNTPGELNVVVPEFPAVDEAVRQMTEEDLARVAGGEFIVVSGVIAFAIGSIGMAAGVGVAAASTLIGGGILACATLGAVVAGAAILGGTVAAGIAGAAGVALGIGLAYKGSQGGPGIEQNIGICT